MTTIAAIDPGKNGGIAWCCPGDKPCCVPMPETEGDLIARLRTLTEDDTRNIVFYLEDLVKHAAGNAIPASTMAVYGANWGMLKGAIMYSGSPLHIVQAKSWQKALCLGVRQGLSKRDWKNKLKARAQQLYPHLDVTLKTADALLLLEHAIKEQRGEQH